MGTPLVFYSRSKTGLQRNSNNGHDEHFADDVDDGDVGGGDVDDDGNDVGDEYKTPDYSRLVSISIHAVTSLAARVQELEMTTTKKRKKDGSGSKQPI